MDSQRAQPDGDLFSESIIRSYVDGPHFVERRWLVERVETALADPDCRFVLLTAEPGAGKSAFLADLARHHPEWPRYFIRRDQISPFGSPGARAFLLQAGLQLAAIHPRIFASELLEITIRQRLGTVGQDATVVGAEVKRLIGSPFRRAALAIIQEVERTEGNVAGLRVGEWITDPHLIPLADLQSLALLDPAATLQREAPEQRIVILIDALDELRYQDPDGSLLAWLETCPKLPANVRFVLTSRPEELLNVFRQRQQRWLREETIDAHTAPVQADLRRYALTFTTQEAVGGALAERGIAPDDFVVQAVTKAEGNFQYLAALFRAVEQAASAAEREHLSQLLQLQDMPAGLGALYAFFLGLIKRSVAEQAVEAPGATPFEITALPAWEGLYQPLLGVLAVAREPLEPSQMRGFAGVQVEERWLRGALDRLRQFLDRVDGRYRLYHSTFPEFLTSPATRTAHPAFSLAPAEWHRKIAAHYRGRAPSWGAVQWSAVDDYGLRHLAAHLYALRDADVYRRALYRLICPSFMQAKHARYGSHQSFAADVALAIEAARAAVPPDLVEEVRACLISATVRSLATNVSPTALRVLALVGQAARAQGLAALMPNTALQGAGYRLIGEALLERGEPDPARDALRQALAAAQAMEEATWSVDSKVDALTALAPALARVGELDRLLAAVEALGKSSLLEGVAQPARANALGRMAQALAEAGVRESAADVANRALRIADGITDPETKVQALSRVAEAIDRAGDRAGATAVANRALATAETMSSGWNRAQALSTVAQALARVGAIDRAMAVTETVGDARARTNALKEITLASTRARDFDRAEAAAGSIGDAETRADVLGRVASALAWSDHRDRAPEVVNQALTAARAIADDAARWRALGQVVEVLTRVEGVDRALEVVETLADEGAKADALSRVADTLSWSRQHARATAVAERALSASGALGEGYARADAFSRVGRVLTQAGDADRVLAAIEGLQDRTITDRVLNTISQTLAQGGHVERAVTLAERIHDPWPRGDTLARIAEVLARSGETRRATEVVNRALAAVETVGDRDRMVIALGEIAWALATCGKQDRAAIVASRMLAAAEAIEGDMARTELLNLAASILALADEPQRAADVAQRVVAAATASADPYATVAALRMAARTLAASGETERAAEAIDQALAAVERIADPEGKAEALLDLSELLAQAGQIDKGTEVLNRALEESKAIWSGWAQVRVLSRAAQFLAQRGATQRAAEAAREALAVAREAPGDEHLKGQGLSLVVQALAKVGEFDEALAVAETIWMKPSQVEAYGWVALASARAGQEDRAAGAAHRALDLAEGMGIIEEKAGTLSGIAHMLAEIGEDVRAADVARRALVTGETVRDDQTREGLLIAAARALARTGQCEQALSAWRAVFSQASLDGRGRMFVTLTSGAELLATIDAGQTLADIAEVIVEVESWWEQP